MWRIMNYQEANLLIDKYLDLIRMLKMVNKDFYEAKLFTSEFCDTINDKLKLLADLLLDEGMRQLEKGINNNGTKIR